MNNKNKMFVASCTLLAAMGLFGTAAAVPLTGSFTLRADGFTPNFQTGDQIAEATFTTLDVDPMAGNLFTVEFLNSSTGASFDFTAVRLSEIEVTDVFGNTYIGGSSAASSDFSGTNEPYAVLNANPSSQVDFILGNAQLSSMSNNVMHMVNLNLTFDEANGTQGTFLIQGANYDLSTNSLNLYGASGNQYIPEPGVLALFSAGLLSIGFSRRRSKYKLA